MTTKYLLACPCGEMLTVDASESGLTRSCKCGAALEVPTLRGLANLQRVADDAPPRTSAWGNRQRGILIGLVIAVLGFGLGLYRETLPQLTPRSFFGERELSADAPPAEVYELFRNVENEGLQALPRNVRDQYDRQRLMTRWWKFLGYGIGLVGLLVIGASFLLTMSWRPASRPPAARRETAPT